MGENGAGGLKLDRETFFERLSAVYDLWKDGEEDNVWNSCNALVIACGVLSEEHESMFLKSPSLQTYFFGYEFPESVTVITKETIHFLSSKKKCDILKTLEREGDEKPELKFHIRLKGDKLEDHINAMFDAVVKGTENPKIGIIKKDHDITIKDGKEGSLARSWNEFVNGNDKAQAVDVAQGWGRVLAKKDKKALVNVKRAAHFGSQLMKKFLVPTIEEVVDEEKEITHSALAEKTDEVFEHPDKIKVKLHPEYLENCYTTIIQSGNQFNLKPSAESNEEKLQYGCITMSIGARYKSFCSNVGRTIFVNPTKYEKATYNVLLEVYETCIDKLKPGNKLCEVYEAAKAKLAEKSEEVASHFLNSCGIGIGIEFREVLYNVNAKNQNKIEGGLVLNLTVGLNNVPNKADENKELPESRSKFACFISDTVYVSADGDVEVLTGAMAKKFGDVSYYLEAEDTQKKEKKAVLPEFSADKELRGESAADAERAERLKHQQNLKKKQMEEAQQRLMNPTDKKVAAATRKLNQLESYPKTARFPKGDVNMIFVDQDRESIILPVCGVPVPFHVMTIKNVRKTEEGSYTYLRFNFQIPGTAANSIPQSEFEGGKYFLRELSYRALDPKTLVAVYRSFNELKKRVTQKEMERRDKASLVAQEALKLAKGDIPRLTDLNIRPILSGKRTAGRLEAHQNGFKFVSYKGESCNIMFGNIKHAFFQAADKTEMLVILHFHLKNHIMLGKKKTIDVQFSTEVGEASYALDQVRRSGHDPDEIEEEQRERQMRNKINAAFEKFVKDVEENVAETRYSFNFDIPYRDLGFHGVPGKSNVFLMPTVNCLVDLVEFPFFVTTLSEVELVHFERVSFNLKNFDLTIVYKDYTKTPARISTIPSQHIDSIKEWLDSCDIIYYEGTANLNWPKIMQTIRDDPKAFFADGGWDFLKMDSDSDGEEEEEESEFEPESEEDEESTESEYSEEEESEDETMSDASDDEEGLDWDDLHKEAARADREKEDVEGIGGKKSRRRDDDSDDERRKKKKTSKSKRR